MNTFPHISNLLFYPEAPTFLTILNSVLSPVCSSLMYFQPLLRDFKNKKRNYFNTNKTKASVKKCVMLECKKKKLSCLFSLLLLFFNCLVFYFFHSCGYSCAHLLEFAHLFFKLLFKSCLCLKHYKAFSCSKINKKNC